MREHEDIVHDESSRRINPVIIALLGGIALLLAVLWFFSSNRNPDQDKLSNPQIEQLGDLLCIAFDDDEGLIAAPQTTDQMRADPAGAADDKMVPKFTHFP